MWEETKGLDGYVSLEVSPTLANDTEGTIAAAQRLWNAVDRPNVMIKIPGTAAGVPAIKASIAAGININVTLLFSVDRYEDAANAYLEGLEERASRGEPIDRLASVASVFVSRIDNAVDKKLQAKIDAGEHSLESLLGKAAVASTKLTYQRFLKLFGGDRFAALKAKGAHVQRPLWASTSTKKPGVSRPTMYVKNIIGRDTVNTVPPNTLEALLDHGTIRADAVLEDIDGARAVIDALAKAQISIYDVTETLITDGVKSFADSFNAMLDAIKGKLEKLRSGAPPLVSLALGSAHAQGEACLDKLAPGNFLQALWHHDPAPWSNAPEHVEIIKKALGWVEIAQQTHAQTGELREFASACAKKFDHVVVLGMGGSSLAPDVLRATFGKIAGYPALHVLDSTDTQQIKALDDSLDIARSLLLIVASKSGTTTEPDAFFRYFFQRVQQTVGAAVAPGQFIAITDPGTKMEEEAKDNGFRRVFTNDPTSAGGTRRFVLRDGAGGAGGPGRHGILDHATTRCTPTASTVSSRIRRASLRRSHRHAGEERPRQGDPPAHRRWRPRPLGRAAHRREHRQGGHGDRPVAGEPLGGARARTATTACSSSSASRLRATLPRCPARAVREAGQPVMRLKMDDAVDLGAEFFRWEIATAAAGSVLGINPFDRPNVQEAKDNTKRLLGEFGSLGKLSDAAAGADARPARVPASGCRREAR